MTSICLIGFGEVGVMLADELAQRAKLAAWDTQFVDLASKPARALENRRVRAGASAADAAGEAAIVISAVTAAQTAAAAEAAAPGLKDGAFFLDLNSASPAAKIVAAAAVERAGGRYVEAAIMAPVAPKRLATSILLGGPHAATFLPIAKDIGFAGARFFDAAPGRAAAAKLCRSVVIKGIEALLLEALVAARFYGVEHEVIVSLSNMFPGPDWRELSGYMIGRAVEHGARRAEEMREAARTVAEAGLEPLMSDACAARQDWTARVMGGVEGESLEALLDAMRAALAPDRSGDTRAKA